MNMSGGSLFNVVDFPMAGKMGVEPTAEEYRGHGTHLIRFDLICGNTVDDLRMDMGRRKQTVD